MLIIFHDGRWEKTSIDLLQFIVISIAGCLKTIHCSNPKPPPSSVILRHCEVFAMNSFPNKADEKKRELSSSTHNERNSLGNTRDRTERDWTFRTVCWHIRLTKITVQRKRKFIYMKRTNEMVRLSCKRRYAYFVAINTKHDWNNTHEHGARAVDTNEKYSSALK